MNFKLNPLRQLSLAPITAGLLLFGLPSCEEKSESEKAAEEIEEAADEVGDAVEDAVE